MAARKRRSTGPSSEDFESMSVDKHAEGDKLLDELLKQDEVERESGSKQKSKKSFKAPTKDAGCCNSGGGCGPQLTAEDHERLENARKKYREQKAKEASEAPDPTPIRDFFLSFFKLIGILMTIFVFVYLKSGAEQYASDRSIGDHLDTNPYQTLGIKPNAPLKEVRRSFRQLTLQWHPDKNPGCADTCEDKMAQISEAYSILSDPVKRSAYDKGGVIIGDKISSPFSVDLTDETYNLGMASLNDLTLPITPIVIQVYDPQDDACQSFAQIWDGTAESLSHMNIPFVRINALTDNHLVRKLPINVQIYPTVLILERNKQPQILPRKSAREPRLFKAWIEDTIGPPDMVKTARNPEALEAWAQDTCKLRHTSALALPDDRARLIVVTHTNRITPSATVKRVALHLNSVADILYASPRAIPKSWKGDVDSSRNNLILLPKCTNADLNQGLAKPQKVLSFGKTSYNEFYSNISHLLSHRALPLTRQSADALCSSSVMGTAKRICHVKMLYPIFSSVEDFDEEASKRALTDREFQKLQNLRKDETTNDDDDDEDDAEKDIFIPPMVQYVYVLDDPHERDDASCTCPTSRVKQVLKKYSDEESALLDFTTGFIRPLQKTDRSPHLSSTSLSKDILQLVPLNADKHPCLASVTDFMNLCLEPGESSMFSQVKQHFAEYSTFDWFLFAGGVALVAFLTMTLSASQWCLLLFASPVIVQIASFVHTWLSTVDTYTSSFDEL